MAIKELAGLEEFASRFMDVEAMPWIETAPGHHTKVLMHDPETGMLTIISRIAPGGTIPFHVHEDLEQTYILEGSFKDDEGECTAGNFIIRPKGSKHSPVAPDGCTMLVFFMRPTSALRKSLENYPGVEMGA
jgi:anti-sigma factor ChrR (cupin superfamily)